MTDKLLELDQISKRFGSIVVADSLSVSLGRGDAVGVQWRKGTKYPYSMVVVDNSANKDVPTNGDLLPTNA